MLRPGTRQGRHLAQAQFVGRDWRAATDASLRMRYNDELLLTHAAPLHSCKYRWLRVLCFTAIWSNCELNTEELWPLFARWRRRATGENLGT